MKNNTIINVLTIVIAFNVSCSEMNEFDPVLNKAEQTIKLYSEKICKDTKDAISYPIPWTQETANTFKISDTKLQATSTCGLIQTYVNQPWNVLGPWCSICSNYNIDGLAQFNESINNNNVTIELFARSDAQEKLFASYTNYINSLKQIEEHPGLLYSFELLLASEKMESILSETTSDQLLLLAMKMMEVKRKNQEFKSSNSLAITRHILLKILLNKGIKELTEQSLKIGLFGYEICYMDGYVEDLAKQYIIENSK